MLHRTFHITGLFIFLAVLLALPGCEDPDKSRGSFSMYITGDINHKINGNAVFGGATDPESREQGFALILTTGKTNPGKRLDGEALYLAILQPGGPQPGSYDIVNPDASANRLDSAFWGYARFDAEPFITFVTQTGAVTIETSEEDQLSGTFQLRAVGYDFSVQPAERNEVILSGEFSSKGGYAYIPDL
ncbi:MAG: hypothetical protein U5K31_04770 [Balneolaceae bacterium]|nr:hypothetical protein [Balneolaceae bacterium]